jgi:hypothetical protein
MQAVTISGGKEHRHCQQVEAPRRQIVNPRQPLGSGDSIPGKSRLALALCVPRVEYMK